MSKPNLSARVTEAANELDQRFHLAAGLRRQINKVFPTHWSFMLGEIALYSFIVVPALTHAFAHLSGDDARKLTVRLVAQHYFSHYLPRFGTAGEGEYHLAVHSDSRNLIEDITVGTRTRSPFSLDD